MLDAFFAVDKPSGPSSRAVVDAVAKAVGDRRAGHAGTLDPMARGVVVVAVGKATRLLEYVQSSRKVYSAQFELGATSDTDDATGRVERHSPAQPPTRQRVESALGAFVGRILQRPPDYSAIKVAGRRAYRLARSGEPIRLAAREVVVHAIELIEYDYPRLSCRIVCGSGVYIRSIGRDLGESLGIGAIMTGLCREAVGDFKLEDAAPLAAFESIHENETGEPLWMRFRRPLAIGVQSLNAVRLNSDKEKRFRLGQAVPWAVNTNAANAATDANEVAVWNEAGDLVGIGRFDRTGGWLRPIKGGFAPKERNGQ